MSSALASRPRLREESGFTLIELLVVMLAGTVVMGAIFTMLDVTIRQTSRTFSEVNASQTARMATERIETELHSSCVGYAVYPIQTGSDANDLIFLSQWGSASSGNTATSATPTPVEHKIVYSPTAKTLTDYTYASTGGSSPNWTFSSTPSKTEILAENASQRDPTPVFQYFAYSQPMNGSSPYTDSSGNTYEMIQDGINYLPGSTSIQPAASPESTPLAATSAADTAEVLVTFAAGPDKSTLVNGNAYGATANVQDQIVLRLTPPANHAGGGATFMPCS